MDYSLTLCLLLAVAAIGLLRPIRGQKWTYKDIVHDWQADETTEADEEEATVDYRYITYRKNLETGSFFNDPNLVSFVQLELDEEGEQLLVGGRNNLYRLHLDNMTLLEHADWAPYGRNRTVCQSKGQPQHACHNFIRVLIHQPGSDVVFVCGTNAFFPACTWRYVNNLSTTVSNVPGRGISPFSPDYNSTALITNSGQLYAATVIDFSGRDSAISRHLSKTFLRTMKGNSKWLNEPNFVSAYEIGNYVYFFFREVAVEYINCGKKIFSRVARMCKTDKGGPLSLQNTWTTFLKARLNCSLPGSYPFYFDELQSTYYSPEKRLIYAVFTTQPNAIAGSAVCAYDADVFDTVFAGNFKHRDNVRSAWVRHDNHFSGRKCASEKSGSKRSPEILTNVYMAAKKYQLMDQAVPTADLGPLIMRDGERWTHIVVDHVVTKTDHTYDIMFLATVDGRLRKMVRLPNSINTCLIEEIKIVANGHPRPVKSMKISHKKSALYLATDGEILKVPVQRCYRFHSFITCLAAQDPYCGWNEKTNSCTPAPNGNPKSEGWSQDIQRCPQLDLPINGNWAEWSGWNECRQVGLDRMVDQCLCRSRTCTRPAPAHQGMDCQGSQIEVTNCTVHGSWTDWSEWSACSQTCGLAIKVRKRQCGNPPPKFGGRDCQGNDEERITCVDNPECPLVPVHGKWSKWSGWSQCTRNCNSGIQRRKRACSSPYPSRGGRHCVGNKEEWRMCNTLKCQEFSKQSPWTDWVRTNETRGGYFQQRFRFNCRAKVENSKDIKTSFSKSQAQFCFKSDRGCYKRKEIGNIVTSIDTFTSVDRVLKRYCRKRRRLFKKYCKCRTLGVFLVCQRCTLG